MKCTAILLAALVVNSAGGTAALCEEKVSNQAPQTFAIETFVGRTYYYLDNMVDKDGLPYFNIFWTDPAEAAHDWPDFGDVMSRQLQAAIMARHLTGKEARNENLWMNRVLSYLDPKTGLLMRPKTSFSVPVADVEDQALTLYALVTVSQGWSGWRDKGSIWKIPPTQYKELLEKAKAVIRTFPAAELGSRMLLLDNWNEWSEGHYLAPHREYGFR